MWAIYFQLTVVFFHICKTWIKSKAEIQSPKVNYIRGSPLKLIKCYQLTEQENNTYHIPDIVQAFSIKIILVSTYTLSCISAMSKSAVLVHRIKIHQCVSFVGLLLTLSFEYYHLYCIGKCIAPDRFIDIAYFSKSSQLFLYVN